jgi:CheY-like chemotaxis protein
MVKVLIVDNREDDLSTMKTILVAHNHEVVTALNAKEAMGLLDKSTFDLILVDVLLPDISGIKLIEYIRDKVGQNIKCICVSILDEKELGKTTINGYVQKPFTPDDLIKEVDRCLEA